MLTRSFILPHPTCPVIPYFFIIYRYFLPKAGAGKGWIKMDFWDWPKISDRSLWTAPWKFWATRMYSKKLKINQIYQCRFAGLNSSIFRLSCMDTCPNDCKIHYWITSACKNPLRTPAIIPGKIAEIILKLRKISKIIPLKRSGNDPRRNSGRNLTKGSRRKHWQSSGRNNWKI